MAIENQKWYEQTTKKKALRQSDTATLLRYFFVQIREDFIKSGIVEIKVKSKTSTVTEESKQTCYSSYCKSAHATLSKPDTIKMLKKLLCPDWFLKFQNITKPHKT